MNLSKRLEAVEELARRIIGERREGRLSDAEYDEKLRLLKSELAAGAEEHCRRAALPASERLALLRADRTEALRLRAEGKGDAAPTMPAGFVLVADRLFEHTERALVAEIGAPIADTATAV